MSRLVTLQFSEKTSCQCQHSIHSYPSMCQSNILAAEHNHKAIFQLFFTANPCNDTQNIILNGTVSPVMNVRSGQTLNTACDEGYSIGNQAPLAKSSTTNATCLINGTRSNTDTCTRKLQTFPFQIRKCTLHQLNSCQSVFFSSDFKTVLVPMCNLTYFSQ